jgi:glycosyltransferase involved in cell wall biosynthesis
MAPSRTYSTSTVGTDQVARERTPGLRIVLAIESSGPGGAETVVLRLAEELRDIGHAPVVATLRQGWMTERAAALGLPVWIVPQRSGLDALWVPRFAARLRRERIDLVHTHEFVMNIYAGAAARLVGLPTLATIHGRHWVADQPRRGAAYRLLRRLGLRVVAVSHDLAKFLAPGLGIPLSAITVVHNGIPIPPSSAGPDRGAKQRDARASIGLPWPDPLLVAVGNLYAVKDHANLLRAAATLPDVHVAIAGRGDQEAPLRRLADELGISPRVHLLGLRQDVDRVLLAADVFVQPSRSEGLPLAVLEAMAAALPVVATNVGGVGEAVVDGETGILVPPGDSPALAAAARAVLAMPDRGAGLGQFGRKRAIRDFSVREMVDRYCALYRARGALPTAILQGNS